MLPGNTTHCDTMTFWSQPEIKCGWPDLDEVHYEPASHFPSRTYIIHYTGLVLAIILRARLLLFWFSRERGVFCETVLFWLQTKPQNFQHHKNVCQEIAACNTEPLKHEPTFHDIWLPKYVVLIPSKHFLAKSSVQNWCQYQLTSKILKEIWTLHDLMIK